MAEFKTPRRRAKTLLISVIGLTIALAGGFYLFKDSQPEKTVITTDKVTDVAQGRVVEGNNISAQPKILQTNDTLQFESSQLEVENPKTTAAVLQWSQTG